ncbi:MAG: TIGR02680 family protein [Lachnospiraceae bacterium]
MNNRWKMKRIGFVNFWLYDEEDFEFEDGKLLLRGQNGSGKSITTQSFIPFVLDGDRTPSRLDPFGSSDRRMEYYFLGEEGRDEATGYLFLEFKKEDTEEYRTIGIGQKAKRGKPMDFWGFVILDGRRIGHDIWLYKEVGSTRIPYDKREMRSALGEENFFTDSQSEYKKQVNQSIFGFRKMEHYEQFIKLLVKVRAPKLSKEFKPTKVYEILNDSLQTLTDEDLRAMVDAMEKLDEIQESLEMLNRAFDDVKIIRNEYTRYNQYMLARKAQAYLSAEERVETARKQLDEQEQKMQEAEERQQEKTKRLEAIEEEQKLAETERNGLLDMNLEEIDRKLEQLHARKEEALKGEKRWDDRIQEYKGRIFEEEQQLKEIQNRLELKLEELSEEREELAEQQEILQWEQHPKAVEILEAEDYPGTEEIRKTLERLKGEIEECRKAIRKYGELSLQYDELSSELERIEREKAEMEISLHDAEEQVIQETDNWIQAVFELEKQAEVWKPEKEILQEAEEEIRQYESMKNVGKIQELFRADYERQRQILLDLKNEKEQEKKQKAELLKETEKELAYYQNLEDLEPERDEAAKNTRAALEKSGISVLPFYKTVEFTEGMDPKASARLEAQLQKAGILDALVIADEDLKKVRRDFPEFLDTVLYAPEKGTSVFGGLTVREDLETGLKESVKRILSHMNEDQAELSGILLKTDGWFHQGVLLGRADKNGEAEFVGTLARKRRKEQKIQKLETAAAGLKEELEEIQRQFFEIQRQLVKLQEEYQSLPGFSGLQAALEKEKEWGLKLQLVQSEYNRTKAREEELMQRKNQQYQLVLQKCKPFPYGRTEEAYEEANNALEEYLSLWQKARQNLLQIAAERGSRQAKEDGLAQDEQLLDDAFVEKRDYSTEVKKAEIQISQLEDYLKRPEIAEKAKRLKELREILKNLAEEEKELRESLAVLNDRLKQLKENEPKQQEKLKEEIRTETYLRKYFEEELSLKLIFDREGRKLEDCAQAALGLLRESDKNREPSDLFQSLYRVYQGHNGSLTNYGTSLEDCFGGDFQEEVSALRKRVRIASVWNGKKVYLEEFYGILKASIEETELLIQKKDRELFEDILSQTISQQLTDRIAESRRWVEDMSRLMKEMDTSMGLSFSLDWKPRKAENDSELDTADLEQILLRDRALLTMEDIEKVAAHFRSKIRTEKLKMEENGAVINYMDLVRDALDYRKWFEFHMYFRRGEELRKPLTNAAFNRFSGGEKAMAMYVPLFAAVNAQYKKAEKEDHPRMIALDEAFAGVDDKNISSMFELVHKLDFDYIMNSQALWGCYDTVKGLRIAELLRPRNSQTVSVIHYRWNGYERILDE